MFGHVKTGDFFYLPMGQIIIEKVVADACVSVRPGPDVAAAVIMTMTFV